MTEPRPGRQGVVFDLDGTLVDSEPFWVRGFSTGLTAVLEARGHGRHTVKESDLGRFHGGRVPDSVREILQWLGVTMPEDEADAVIDAVIDAVTAEFVAHPAPIRDAVVTARALHREGVPMAVASSSARVFIDAALEAVGLEDAFAVRLSTLDVPSGKPDPRIYTDAIALLGIDPTVSAAIEDSRVGVRAALAAGLPCVWFTAATDASDEEVSELSARHTQDSDTPILVARALSAELVEGFLDRLAERRL